VRAAPAGTGRALHQPADHQRQDDLENLVVGDVGQVRADLPDMRVLGPVHGEVGGGPRGLVLGLLTFVQGQDGRLQAGSGQGKVAQGPVDPGGIGSLESGLEDGTDEDVDGTDLRGTLGGAVGGECGRRRVGAVRGPEPPRHLDHRADPAGLGLQAGHGLLDQAVRDREDQIVLAGEVTVHRRGIGAQGAAELGQAEPAGPVLVEQPEAFRHDPLRGQASAPETGLPAPWRPAAGRGCHHLPTPCRPFTASCPGGRVYARQTLCHKH